MLTALIAYLHYEAPVEEQNFATLLEMLNTMQVLEDDEEYQNPVDLLFEELAKKKPNSFAGRQYKLYKLAAGKTAKSILISCGARLAPFDIQEPVSYTHLGSGSGKTRFWLKPNLLQCHSSYVVTDPKGYNYRGQSKDAFTKSEKYRIFVTYRIPTKNKRR